MDHKIGKSLQAFNQAHYKNNKIQQIRGFCNVVTFRSVTEAAKIMGLSQPAVSAQIKSLERDLGKVLFKKSGKSIVPTEEGLAFYDFVIPTLKQLDNIYDEYLVHIDENENNTFRIAGYYSALTRFLPKAIHKMLQINPNINIAIEHCRRDEAIEKLRNGLLDAIFFNISDVPQDLTLLKTLTCDPVIAVSPQNPLAKIQRPITLEDLRNQNFLLIDELKVMPIYKELFQRYQIKTKIDFINFDWEGILFFVAQDVGICFFGNLGGNYERNAEIKGLDVGHLFPLIEYKLIIREKKIKPALELFLKVAEETYGTFWSD